MVDVADASPDAAALRARTYELLHTAPGIPVVDVGCGTGRAVASSTPTTSGLNSRSCSGRRLPTRRACRPG